MVGMFRNKKAVSPLVATVILIGFAVTLGAVIMNLGRNYVEKIPETHEREQLSCEGTSVEPLKNLMVSYIEGEITKEEYAQKEKALLSSG